MDAELVERVLECLRDLEIGESISADGIADEIGEKLSDVYDAIEELEHAKMVELHTAYRKGSDPTYTLTPKGKRHMQPEVQEKPELEPAKVDQGIPELRPSADCVCRFCGKIVEPNKLRRHENMCGKNPDRPHTPPKFFKKAKPMEGPAVEVSPPSEYAEDESNDTATIEHEVTAEKPTFAPNPDRCAGCADYIGGECDVHCVTEESCNKPGGPRSRICRTCRASRGYSGSSRPSGW